MKEEIKQVIKGWYYYDKAFGWAEDEDDFVDSLATSLDKAIGIDEKKLKGIIKDNARDYILHGNYVVKVGEVAKAVIKDRPLKCEVEE